MTDLHTAVAAVRLYAESHPRPTQVNQVQAAEMLHISRETVRKMIRRGILRLSPSGLIPIEQIDHARSAQAG